MSGDRFRAWICEDEPGQEWIGSDRMDAADQEMAKDGYEYLEHFIRREDSRTVHVRLYEQRPLTLEEAGNKLADFVAGIVVHPADEEPLAELIIAWRDAVERERAS